MTIGCLLLTDGQLHESSPYLKILHLTDYLIEHHPASKLTGAISILCVPSYSPGLYEGLLYRCNLLSVNWRVKKTALFNVLAILLAWDFHYTKSTNNKSVLVSTVTPVTFKVQAFPLCTCILSFGKFTDVNVQLSGDSKLDIGVVVRLNEFAWATAL